MQNIQFDFPNFITTALGALAGGLLSVYISYYFYIKGKGLEVLTSWMANNIGELFIRQTVPQFFTFSSFKCVPLEGLPVDLDIPHLESVIVNKISDGSGTRLELLFRISDHGWNFPLAAGVYIEDSSGQRHAAKDLLFGYMQAELRVLSSAIASKQMLMFHMFDIQESGKTSKKNMQTIEISDAKII